MQHLQGTGGMEVALQLSTFLRSNVQPCNSFSVTSLAAPHLATSIESHPYKNHGGGPPAPQQFPFWDAPLAAAPSSPSFDVQTFKGSTPYLLTSFRRLIASTFRPPDVQTSRRSDPLVWERTEASGPTVRIGTDSSPWMTDHLSDRLRGTAEFQTRPMDLARKLG
jgi:hypothetical protein